MSNPIQHIATEMFYQWQRVNATEGVRWIRLLINSGDETILDAFYDYMLGIDVEGEDMVFIIQEPFDSLETFSHTILKFINEQVEMWNTSSKPESISFEAVDWKPNYTLGDKNNPAQLAIENLNKLTEIIAGGENLKCCFVLHPCNFYDSQEMVQWIKYALKLDWNKQMTFMMAEVVEKKLLNEVERMRPTNEVIAMDAKIDMDGAMEELAQQAVRESNSDNPQEDLYRLALIRLVNAVKKRDNTLALRQAKVCLDIAVEGVKRDVNWIAQVVTIYTILYTDSIGNRNYEDAHYYADKAIQTAELGIDRLDPSIAYRLLGNALLGKAGIYLPTKDWEEACPLYKRGAEAYGACQDYLMQTESLRMCAVCWEHRGENKIATEVYLEAFSLLDHLSPEMIKSSTFPMILIALTNNPHRVKILGDREFDQKLATVLGKDWKDFLYEYKKSLKTPPQTTSYRNQQDGADK